MLNRTKHLFLYGSVISLFSNTALGTVLGNQPAHSWHYQIAPYVWASAITGDMVVKNIPANIHVSFLDILKHLNFAAQGHFEGGYGPWTLMVDPTYLKVSDHHQVRRIGLKITSQTVLVDAGIFYRLFTKTIAAERVMSLELLGGQRYLEIKNTLNFKQRLSVSDKTDMSAPIIGARIKMDLSTRTQFWLRGDYGGFHSDNVHQTWSTTAGFSYAAKPNLDLGIAYRALNIDYDKRSSGMNIIMHGPALGLSVHG